MNQRFVRSTFAFFKNRQDFILAFAFFLFRVGFLVFCFEIIVNHTPTFVQDLLSSGFEFQRIDFSKNSCIGDFTFGIKNGDKSSANQIVHPLFVRRDARRRYSSWNNRVVIGDFFIVKNLLGLWNWFSL